MSSRIYKSKYTGQEIDDLLGQVSSKVDDSMLGAAGGVATLDTSGKIPSQQMPENVAYTNKENTFTEPQAFSYVDSDDPNRSEYGEIGGSSANYSYTEYTDDTHKYFTSGEAYISAGTGRVMVGRSVKDENGVSKSSLVLDVRNNWLARTEINIESATQTYYAYKLPKTYPNKEVTLATIEDLTAQFGALNIQNGSGLKSIQQVKNTDGTTIPIKTKNPNAVAQGAPEEVEIGATGESAAVFGGAAAATAKRAFAAGTNTAALGKYSAAFGDNSVALGNDSFAEGYQNTSGGQASHSEGYSTQSTGKASHSEGEFVISSGEASHAEGKTTIASGLSSHAEGNETTASGNQAHAEGNKTKALADQSHAEGAFSEVKNALPSSGGSGSSGGSTTPVDPTPENWGSDDDHIGAVAHVEGWGTVAYGVASHAEGKTTVAKGHKSHAEGEKTEANGYASHAEGYSNKADGTNSHAEGAENTVTGNNSHVEGYSNTVTGNNSHVEGSYNTSTFDGVHISGTHNEATYGNQFICGEYNDKTKQRLVFMVGNGNSSKRSNAFEVSVDGRASVQSAPVNLIDVVRKLELDRKFDKAGGTVTGNMVVGGNFTVQGRTTTVDSETLRVTDKLIEVGKGNTAPLTSPAGLITPKYDGTNNGGIVYDHTGTAYVGDISLDSNGNVDINNSDLQPIATRNATITNGNLVKWDSTNHKLIDSEKAIEDLIVKSDFNIQNGSGTSSIQQKQDGTSGTFDFTGKNPNATTIDGTLTGQIAYGGIGAFSTALGGKSQASGKRSFAAGTTTVAKGNYSAAFGDNSVALGIDSFASGIQTTASGVGSFSEGSNTIASGDNSHAQGAQTKATGANSFSAGYLTVAEGAHSTAMGAKTTSKGIAATALGQDTLAEGDSSFASGAGCKVLNQYPSSGSGSGGDEGSGSTPTLPDSWGSDDDHVGDSAHAIGRGSKSYGIASTAVGGWNIAYGKYSLAGGYQSQTGDSGQTSSDCAFAFGNYNKVIGNSSIALGENNTATGTSLTSIGTNNKIVSNDSTVLGFNNKVTSNQGASFNNIILGSDNEVADSNNLYLVGRGLKADNVGSKIILGRYNASFEGNFAIGTGSSDSNRKNALVIKDNNRVQVLEAPINDQDVVRKLELDNVNARYVSTSILGG